MSEGPSSIFQEYCQGPAGMCYRDFSSGHGLLVEEKEEDVTLFTTAEKLSGYLNIGRYW